MPLSSLKSLISPAITAWIPAAIFGLAANVPFWAVSHDFGLLRRGLFNVEFFLLGIACLFLPRAVAPVLLLAAIAVDLLSGVTVTYLFIPSETLHAAAWLPEFAPSHRAALARAGLAVGAAVLLSTAAYQPSRAIRRKAAGILLALLLLSVMFDVATGKTAAWRTDSQAGDLRLSRTPLHALWTSDSYTNAQRKDVLANAAPTQNHLSSTLLSVVDLPGSSASVDTLPNLVLVLLESWGQPTDDDLQTALLQPYAGRALRELYGVQRGSVSFHGPTIDGESRELCGSGMGLGLLAASSAELRGCLPAQLEQRGYRTIAMHGNAGRVYGRGDWWKTIGFNELWFREQFAAQEMPVCPGGFPGICDASIAEWLGERLQEPSIAPRFFYWVTLNSHLPVPVPNRVQVPPSCSMLSPVNASATLCSWYQLVFNVHRGIAAVALHPAQRPTVFLIVGDHQPPFASPSLRGQFSSQVVPYILLTPRQTANSVESVRAPLIAKHRLPRRSANQHP